MDQTTFEIIVKVINKGVPALADDLLSALKKVFEERNEMIRTINDLEQKLANTNIENDSMATTD